MKIEVELKPMSVPNFVIQKTNVRLQQEGVIGPPKYALKDIDAKTLDKLCVQFREDVFKKAGKTDPRKCENSNDLTFQQGYVCACANLMTMHGNSTEVKELLKSYGPIDWDTIDEYDHKILSEIIN